MEIPSVQRAQRVLKEGAWSLIGIAAGAAASLATVYWTKTSHGDLLAVMVSVGLALLAYMVSVTLLSSNALKFIRIFEESQRLSTSKDVEIERLNEQHQGDLRKISGYDRAFRKLAVARAEFDTKIFKNAIESKRPVLESLEEILSDYLIEVCNTAVIAMTIRHEGKTFTDVNEISEFTSNIKEVYKKNGEYYYDILARSRNTMKVRYADDSTAHLVHSHACFVDCLHRTSHDLHIPNLAEYNRTYKARGDRRLTAPTDEHAKWCKSMYVAEMYVDKKDQPELIDPVSSDEILKDTRENWVYGFITVESNGDYLFEELSDNSALDSGIFYELGFEAVSAIRFYKFAYDYASPKSVNSVNKQ